MSSAPLDSAGLFVIGATHQRTPLEVREQLALADDAIESYCASLPDVPNAAADAKAATRRFRSSLGL